MAIKIVPHPAVKAFYTACCCLMPASMCTALIGVDKSLELNALQKVVYEDEPSASGRPSMGRIKNEQNCSRTLFTYYTRFFSDIIRICIRMYLTARGMMLVHCARLYKSFPKVCPLKLTS